MMPFVSPAPLSACTLVGIEEREAPAVDDQLLRRRRIAARRGRRRREAAARRAGGAGRRAPARSVPPRNMIITGTGPFASAGSTSVIGMSTAMDGYAELSTWPTSCLPTTRRPPTRAGVGRRRPSTSTFGTFFGMRPYTSRSKSSTISARRRAHRRARRRPSGRSSASARRAASGTDWPSPRRSSRDSAPARCRSARAQRGDAELRHHLPVVVGRRSRPSCRRPALAVPRVRRRLVEAGCCARRERRESRRNECAERRATARAKRDAVSERGDAVISHLVGCCWGARRQCSSLVPPRRKRLRGRDATVAARMTATHVAKPASAPELRIAGNRASLGVTRHPTPSPSLEWPSPSRPFRLPSSSCPPTRA